MPHVADDGSPLHERLVYGKSGTSYLPVLVDTDGNLAVALTADQNVQARNYGYYGAAWVKSGIPLAPSGVVAERRYNLALAAGTNNVDLTAVPANTLYIMTSLSFLYEGTVPTLVTVQLVSGAVPLLLFRQLAPVSGQVYDRQGYWVVPPAGFIRCEVVGATLNNDLYIFGNGYSVNLT